MKNIIIYIVLGIIIICLGYSIKKEKDNAKRLYDNIETIIKENKFYKDSMIASNNIIRLELSELKKLYPELKKELKEVNINVKDVKQFQRTQLEINTKFQSLIEKKNDTTLLSRYTDKYINYLSTINLNDSTEYVQMIMPARLDQVVYSKRKNGFWNWVLNKRELTQKIWTDNPYVKIEYNQIIKVEN